MNLEVPKYPYEYDFNEILIISWNFFTSNYTQIFKVAFISYFFTNLIIILLPDFDIKGVFTFDFVNIDYIALYIVIIFFLTSVSNIPLIIFIKRSINKDIISIYATFREFYKVIFAHWVANLFTVILFFSMFYLWINSSLKFPRIFIFTFLPVIVLLIYSSFSVLVLANKGISLWDSFKYSFSVVKGRWLKVFMFILIIYVLSALTSVTVGIPYIFLSRNLFTELIFNTIVNVICSFFVILNTVLFINFDDTKLL